MNKIQVVDHSGRGHAWAAYGTRTDPDLSVLYVPGCRAIQDPRIISAPQVGLGDQAGMVELARTAGVDAVLVANTSAIAAGLPDIFRQSGIPTIGPDHRAAKLEGSKIFGKQMAVKYGVPVAEHWIFHSYDEARRFVLDCGFDVVIKADGLAAGLGTTVCRSKEEADEALKKLMVEKSCGDAGNSVVVERRMDGIEFSFSAMVDGRDAIMLPTSVDFPKPYEGNHGPTCGGVAAISPHPLETPEIVQQAIDKILNPTLRCIAEENMHYSGILYMGAMLVEGRLILLEYNVRLGDPEAGAVLKRVTSSFGELCEATISGGLGSYRLEVSPEVACNIVAYQGRTKQIGSDGKNKGWYRGWPEGRYGKGYPISGLEEADPSKVLFAQATYDPDKGAVVSDGSRILNFVGTGPDLNAAARDAYDGLNGVSFEGMQFRTDVDRCMPWDKPND